MNLYEELTAIRSDLRDLENRVHKVIVEMARDPARGREVLAEYNKGVARARKTYEEEMKALYPDKDLAFEWPEEEVEEDDVPST